MKRTILLVFVVVFTTLAMIWYLNLQKLLKPAEITFSNFKGEEVTMLGHPGEVYVAVKPDTSISAVRDLATQIGGVVKLEIPEYGIYFLEVPVGKEAFAITQLRESRFVVNVSLNEILEAQGLKGKRLLNNFSKISYAAEEESCRVGLVQIDVFGITHGKEVGSVIKSNAGPQNPDIREVDSGATCENGVCRSTGEIKLVKLIEALEEAKKNRRKLIINISLGAKINTILSEAASFSEKQEVNRRNVWKEDQKKILDVISASEWAQQNVLLNIAAGNGSKLVYKGTEITYGIDLDSAIEDLKKDARYKSVLEKNVIYYGSLDINGERTDYTNYGEEVIYAYEPLDPEVEGKFLSGTSFSAPQGTAGAYSAWSKNCSLTASDMRMANTDSSEYLSAGVRVLNIPKLLIRIKEPVQIKKFPEQPIDGVIFE